MVVNQLKVHPFQSSGFRWVNLHHYTEDADKVRAQTDYNQQIKYKGIIDKVAAKGVLNECNFCGVKTMEKLKACGRCRRVKFCGEECMRQGWALHKEQCAAWCAEAKAAAATQDADDGAGAAAAAAGEGEGDRSRSRSARKNSGRAGGSKKK